jgi:hypothetical protein
VFKSLGLKSRPDYSHNGRDEKTGPAAKPIRPPQVAARLKSRPDTKPELVCPAANLLLLVNR